MMSQSSLERVLVSDSPINSKSSSGEKVSRNPLWSESWFPTDSSIPDRVAYGRRVAILFGASPGFRLNKQGGREP